MTKNKSSHDEVIVSIKLRLGELDFEIFDSNKKIIYAQTLGDESSYGVGYEKGRQMLLMKEKETLEKIMKGVYGRELSCDRQG